MPISILCPACGRTLWLAPPQLGRPVVCPRCRYEWVAEREDETEPEPIRSRRRRFRDDDDDDDDRAKREYVEEAPRRDLIPHRGALILILGLLGLTLSFLAPIGILLGLAAWVMGQGDLAQMRRKEMDAEGHGLTVGGLITGILGLVVSLLFLLACAGMWTAVYSYRPGRWAPPPPRVAPAPMPLPPPR